MGSRGKVLQSDIRRAVEGFARPYLAPSWYTLSDVDQAALVAASEAKRKEAKASSAASGVGGGDAGGRSGSRAFVFKCH